MPKVTLFYAPSDPLSTLNDLCPKWLKKCALSDPPTLLHLVFSMKVGWVASSDHWSKLSASERWVNSSWTYHGLTFFGGMKLITVLLSHWDEALWFCDYRCDALRLQLHPDLWSSYGFGRSTLGTETLWTLQHLGYDVPCCRCFFSFRRCIWQSLWNEWIINQWIVEWNFEDYSTSPLRRHVLIPSFPSPVLSAEELRDNIQTLAKIPFPLSLLLQFWSGLLMS